mmetsp:Transcript_30776/g.40658  ORF Transcript_30776/g.40658 Transcript_30776/m.40658 type:complete len:80 (-) Transcript_30776:55-294(-)
MLPSEWGSKALYHPWNFGLATRTKWTALIAEWGYMDFNRNTALLDECNFSLQVFSVLSALCSFTIQIPPTCSIPQLSKI